MFRTSLAGTTAFNSRRDAHKYRIDCTNRGRARAMSSGTPKRLPRTERVLKEFIQKLDLGEFDEKLHDALQESTKVAASCSTQAFRTNRAGVMGYCLDGMPGVRELFWRRYAKMRPFGADTILFINAVPICVECDEKREQVASPHHLAEKTRDDSSQSSRSQDAYSTASRKCCLQVRRQTASRYVKQIEELLGGTFPCQGDEGDVTQPLHHARLPHSRHERRSGERS